MTALELCLTLCLVCQVSLGLFYRDVSSQIWMDPEKPIRKQLTSKQFIVKSSFNFLFRYDYQNKHKLYFQVPVIGYRYFRRS